jgi:hypothetical protein
MRHGQRMFERSRLGRSGRHPHEIPTINVVVGQSDGQPVLEEIPADPIGEGRFRLLATPGIAEGLAADDIIELDSGGRATVVQRGRNLGIQVYSDHHHAAEAVDALIDAIEGLGGWLDGYTAGRVIALTVPVDAGFTAVEAVLNACVGSLGGDWYFTNVYAPGGDIPLNWWQ